jgi:uncharacterized protein (TIGR03086 family)
MTGGPADHLALALNLTGELVDGVRAGQWDDPTPCAGWMVRDLVRHMVTGNQVFAAVLSGTPLAEAGTTALAAPPPADLAGAFRESAERLRAAFGQPGALDQVVTIPVGTMPGAGAARIRMVEMLVHGWDLAEATGQATAFPEDLAEQALAFTRPQLEALPPGRSPFSPPQPVAGDAPAILRLVACLGRSVPAAG